MKVSLGTALLSAALATGLQTRTQGEAAGVALAAAAIVALLLGFTNESEPNDPLRPQDYAAMGLGPIPRHAKTTAIYLDLVKRALINVIYHEQSHQMVLTRSTADNRPDPVLARTFSLRSRVLGDDQSLDTMTMIGLKRLDALQTCIETIITQDVKGDLLEAGVARGGACIFMRAALRAHDDRSRRVFCCDAFAPGPPPSSPLLLLFILPLWWVVTFCIGIAPFSIQRRVARGLLGLQRAFPSDSVRMTDDTVRSIIFYFSNILSMKIPDGVHLGSSLECVRSHFARFGLLDEQVVFLPGFFSVTLPCAPIEQLSLLRLDGDFFTSTWDALVHCYPKLNLGGFVLVDDYFAFEECRRAVDTYRSEHQIVEELVVVDHMSAMWRKTQ